MKVAHIFLALLPLALATPAPEAEFAVAVEEPLELEARGGSHYAAIKKDVSSLSKVNAKLKKTLAGVHGKLTGKQEVAIEKDSETLEKLVSKAIGSCKSSSKFSKSQSNSGFKALSKLQKATAGTIKVLISKKKELHKTKSIVCSNLAKLKKGSGSLGKCLAGKSTGPAKKKAGGLEKKFAADFSKGEKAYGC